MQCGNAGGCGMTAKRTCAFTGVVPMSLRLCLATPIVAVLGLCASCAGSGGNKATAPVRNDGAVLADWWFGESLHGDTFDIVNRTISGCVAPPSGLRASDVDHPRGVNCADRIRTDLPTPAP